MSKQKQKTICVHNIFSPCSKLGIFLYWSGNSMDNLLSYCGLVDAKISTSEEDLPVHETTKLATLNQMQYDGTFWWHSD